MFPFNDNHSAPFQHHQQSFHQQQHPGMMANNMNKKRKHPFELFVGDLSYFCQEKHLIDLFSQFGTVVSARIKRPDHHAPPGRTLMYGFVCLDCQESVQAAVHGLHRTLFMGRRIRVESSCITNDANDPYRVTSSHFQIHVAFFSQYQDERTLVIPTEEYLREIFEQPGDLLDVSVKEYNIYQDVRQQEGFAFVTYLTEEAAIRAMNAYNNIMIGGMLLVITLSYRNPKPQLNPFAIGMQQQQQQKGFHQPPTHPNFHFNQGNNNNNNGQGFPPRSGHSSSSYSLGSAGSSQSSGSFYNPSPSSGMSSYSSSPYPVGFPQPMQTPSQYLVQPPQVSGLFSNAQQPSVFGNVQAASWNDHGSSMLSHTSLASTPSPDNSTLPSHIFRAAPSSMQSSTYPSISQTSSGELSASANYDTLVASHIETVFP